MSPDWLGNPQHAVVGALLAFAVAHVTRDAIPLWWARVTVGIGVTLIAEIVWELAEYAVLYHDEATVEEYLDTLADLASSLVGAAFGAAAALLIPRRT